MSYGQTFKGSFSYTDPHLMEISVDAFAELLEESVVGIHALVRKGLRITIDYECSAPASRYETTLMALEALGALATRGSIQTTFDLDGLSRERVSYGGRTPAEPLPARHYRWDVYCAARAGDPKQLKALRSVGVSLSESTAHYRQPPSLHLAAAAGNAKAVRILIDAGCDPNELSNQQTPLSMAANADVARMLLEAGADRDAVVWGTHPVIVMVAMYGRADVVDLLLDAGAKIPATSHKEMARATARRGMFSLLHALVQREAAFVSVLSDPSVIEDAISGDHPVLVDFLLEHGAVLPDSFLRKAIYKNATALVSSVLTKPDALSQCGDSSHSGDAMCCAASEGNLAMMQLLARHGVPVHPAMPGETSPLYCAAGGYREGASACVRWLLDAGAPATASDALGRTAVRAACRLDVIAILAERGADVGEVDPPNQLDPEEEKKFRHWMSTRA